MQDESPMYLRGLLELTHYLRLPWLRATRLSDAAIAALLADLAKAPLGMTEDQAFRISLAGAQEKTALLFQNGRWCMPVGTTPTTHILKPAIGPLPDGIDFSESVENEFLCMRLMAAFGLPTARVDMAEFAGRRALVIERFDRRWTQDGHLLRLPQEDMCQATGTPPGIKYEVDGGPGLPRLLRLLAGSDDPIADRGALLKATIAFWLLGATDGHAKNVSVFLHPGGRFGMTPFYDVLSAQPAVDAGQLRRNRFPVVDGCRQKPPLHDRLNPAAAFHSNSAGFRHRHIYYGNNLRGARDDSAPSIGGNAG